MAKIPGKLKRLNNLFDELGLETIPEYITKEDAIRILEESGGELQVNGPPKPSDYSDVCEKLCYSSRNLALQVIKKRRRQGSGPLREYWCESCHAFHISSSI